MSPIEFSPKNEKLLEAKINYITPRNKGNKTFKFVETKEMVEDQAHSMATQD